MNKFSLLIMSLYASLCPMGTYAQEGTRQVLSIDEMFSLADRNSKTLRPHVSGVNEAVEGIRVARTARLPEIDVSLSFSYLGNGSMIDRDFSKAIKAPMPHFGNNFALEASQVVYAGGAISNSIAVAELQKEKALLNVESQRDRIRFVLIGYYLDLFKQQNMLQVYEKNIEQTGQVLEELRAKGKEGIVLKNDITRYELLLSNLELTCTQIQNNLAILNHHLTTTLGLSDSIRLQPDTAILHTVLPVESRAQWTSEAFAHSPTLKQQSLAVEISKRQDKIVRSERIPKIAAFAGNRFDGPIIIEVPPINKNFNYWYVGIGLKYNLASLYKTDKAVARSKFTVRRALEQYEDAKEQTALAVQADHIKYMESYVELATQQKSVELAHQNYAVIRDRYKNDMALITDMLDASNAKLAAEVQLVNAQIHIVFNYYKLLYTSGTL